MSFAFVGAHPVGDVFCLCGSPPCGRWRAVAVCVQSPTGVGSYKMPFTADGLERVGAHPVSDAFALVGAHPVGDAFALVGAHPVGDGVPWRCA